VDVDTAWKDVTAGRVETLTAEPGRVLNKAGDHPVVDQYVCP
jgi:hypothetical protein